MLLATLRGRYDGMGRLLLILAGTAYIISPIDVVPELFFLVFGLADDAIVIGWIAGALLAETERFLAWEGGVRTTGGPVVEGEVA
jgi:uncharacterized membrane protein YkvA (DUF1232 family)